MFFYHKPQHVKTFNQAGYKAMYRVNLAKTSKRKAEPLPAVTEPNTEPEQARKLMLEVMGQPIRSRGELFSANDLHKIAGGARGKEPSMWLENKQTKELINVICRTGIPVLQVFNVLNGNTKNRGVWLCEDLMYGYAMWLSPEFHLMVIRCFKEYAAAMIIRHRLRGESKELNDTLLISRKEAGKDTKFYHYANEYKMLNRVVLGMSMDRYIKAHGIPKGKIRDYLTPELLKRLDKLISCDITFMELDYSYAEREAELIKINDRLIARERLAVSTDE
ncbi:TPA: KilA-N domain-containing protein [Citrobacter freundii]|nr:KilA-N domain-containing protein [Citrobacter freundii]HCB1516954.1 KilA-N domain-containing protein [Citrobacter freundii]